MSKTPENTAGFVRGLGFWGAYALIAGSMIGTGIFFFVSPVAVQVGTPGAILSAWAAGAVLAACGALSLAELAASYPHAGGNYVFLREAYGGLVAFLYVWLEFLIVRIGNIAIFALAFAGFTLAVAGVDAQAYGMADEALALGAVAAVTAWNAGGVRVGGRIQVALTAAKLGALVVLIAVAAAFAAGLLTGIPGDELPTGAAAAVVDPTLVGFVTALIPIMWSFGGWDEATFVAEEVERPQRNIPRAILAGVVSVGVLYLLVNTAYLVILTPSGLAASGRRTAALALERAAGAGAAGMLNVVLAVSVLGTLNAVMMSGARIAYAVARDLPRVGWLARLSPRTGTPNRALAFEGVFAAAVVVVIADPYAILYYTAVSYWLFAGMVAGAALVLRRRHPEQARPFRMPGYPWPSLIFVATAAAMAAAAARESPAGLAATAATLLTGTVAYRAAGRG